MTSYPGALDTLATGKARTTISGAGADPGDHAQHHNDVAAAVNAIEAELGINPSGAASTVNDRLDTADTAATAAAAAIAVLQTRTVELIVALPGTTLVVGEAQAVFLAPASFNGLNLTGVYAGVNTPSSSGLPNFQVARQRGAARADALSTPITVNVSAYNSGGATTPAVIDGTKDDCLTGDFWIVDVDLAGTGTAGAVVALTFSP